MTGGRLPPGIIINADDLAIHPRINAGIVSAYRNGLLTSATMLVCTPYLEETVREVVRPGEIPVGLHLSLTLGRAIAPLRDVPDLVDQEGYLKHSASHLLLQSFAGDQGRRLLGQIRREFAAQLALARDYGVAATHLDTHQHVHMNPAVFAIFEEEAQRFGVGRIRVCREPFPSFALYLGLPRLVARKNHAKWALMRWLGRRIRPRLATTDGFFGTLYSGITSKRVLISVLNWASPGRSLEIGIHPGFPVAPTELTRSEAGFGHFLASTSRQQEHDALIDADVAAVLRQRRLQARAFDGAIKPGL
jgi:predicted glycoside hydrolase/deacetylase ChbG (UPF0249 family)